jgi:hypothetical protein
MNRKIYDVKKDGNVWKGISRNGDRASVVSSTKADAVKKTSEIAKSHGNSQVVIRKADGKIQSERTYGNDPKSSKG